MAKNPNIDDDTRARAMQFVADKAASAKQRVVGKKELEDSGLSLRDFLNKERGLSRRGPADPTAGEARDKAAQTAADSIDPGAKDPMSAYKPRGSATQQMVDDGGESVVRRQDAEAQRAKDMSAYNPRRTSALSDVVQPGTNTNYENKDVSDMGMKRGGAVKKMAKGGMSSALAKHAAKPASKAHAGLKGGGTVRSASSRADGIAQRGKTRA